MATDSGIPTAHEVSGTGIAWQNKDLVLSDSGTVTSAALTVGTQNSENLDLTTIGLSIPAGSTINGVQVTIEARILETGFIGTAAAHVDCELLVAGSPVGNSKATASLTGTLTDRVLGGEADTWGATLSAAQVAADTFGVRLVADGTITGNKIGTVGIDVVAVVVWFTASVSKTIDCRVRKSAASDLGMGYD